MNVLSLFDGISCGQLALNRAGIPYNNYYASEIDKYAMQVTMENFPETKQLGDITKLMVKDLPEIDLLLGGSPCQGFSFAGKQLNFDDPRSKLFFEYVRILRQCKPKYFLLENVKMKKEYQKIISRELGVEPIEINSALVSAQNRKRLYWTNIPGVTQPEDKNLAIENIIAWSRSTRYPKDKEKYVEQRSRVDGKSNTLTTGSGCGSFSSKNIIFVGGIEIGRRLFDGKNYSRNFREGMRVYSMKGKSAALTSASKGGEGGFSGLYGNTMEDYRQLTPLECERLQTIPDNYTKSVSNTQRYKAIGNGWTIDVITHILKGIK